MTAERASLIADAPRYDRWTHRADVAALVNQAVTTSLRYPYRDLVVTIRRPTEVDGCWCLTNFEPHRHDPGLGKCPPNLAGSDYVRLTIEDRSEA